jgi:hypothetical protein
MTREPITLENVDRIRSRDLHHEALVVLEAVRDTGRDAAGGILRGITRIVVPHHANPSISVETVAFRSSSGDRAGQVTNGSAVWGEWNDVDDWIVTDDGIHVFLDGREEGDA